MDPTRTVGLQSGHGIREGRTDGVKPIYPPPPPPQQLRCAGGYNQFISIAWYRKFHKPSSKPVRPNQTSRLFTQPFIQTQIKENIKAPRHWPSRTNGQLRGKCFHLMTSSRADEILRHLAVLQVSCTYMYYVNLPVATDSKWHPHAICIH